VHLTLKFLGEREPDEVARLAAVLDDAAADASPFGLRFEDVGAFPSPRRPRVIWVGVEPVPELRLLHDGLERRFAALGVPKEDRPFRPHVTLGRVSRDAGPGEFRDFERAARALKTPKEHAASTVDLMRSVLRAEGPTYSKLHGARLGEGKTARRGGRKGRAGG
jgi:2'-5' RNA ligase